MIISLTRGVATIKSCDKSRDQVVNVYRKNKLYSVPFDRDV